jgi:hypothetical protein
VHEKPAELFSLLPRPTTVASAFVFKLITVDMKFPFPNSISEFLRRQDPNQTLVGTRAAMTACQRDAPVGWAGIGQYWQQNPGVAFPYFILRIAADFEISQDITWNVISYRFRDAFDPKDNYNTPQVATGLTFKLDQQSSISVKIIRDWKNGPANDTGVSLGFKQRL